MKLSRMKASMRMTTKLRPAMTTRGDDILRVHHALEPVEPRDARKVMYAAMQTTEVTKTKEVIG